MSAELLRKSLDLVDAADGLPSSSDDKSSKKRQKRKKEGKVCDVEKQRSVFLPSKKAKVKSAIEIAQSKPKNDYLKRNLRYMAYSDSLKVEEKKMRKIISIHQLSHKRKKRALELYEKQQDGQEIWKKKSEKSVFSDADFKNWQKDIVIKKS